MAKADQTALLERYQQLIELSLDLASTLDLANLLNRIVHAAAKLSAAQATSILLFDEKNQQLHFEAASNLTEPLMRGLIVPVEHSIAGWIVTHCQPLIIPDVHKDPRHFGGIAKATHIETTSLLAVPMITKGKVTGVLEAINKQAGEFTEADQNVLMALGAQAAVAIENARLFQQSDLISEMVHELRTPLASLSAAAHLLSRKDFPKEQHERLIQVIYSETDRLSHLATAFLDLARLESGRVQFRAESFDLAELLRECASVFQGKAAEHDLSLEVHCAEKIPHLKADRDKIKQVVLNLLSNAVKYNRPGGRIIISSEAKRGALFLAVQDSGPGIRPEDLKHLFEKFYRVNSAEESAPGSGLGLAICKRIVEAHGGWIEVQSEVGIGTTFTVNLPSKS